MSPRPLFKKIMNILITGAGSSFINVDPSSGHLSVASRIDRDTMSGVDLELTLKVDDSNGNSATESFTITVVDINDSTPKCSQAVYTIQVEEMGPDGKILKVVGRT